MSLYSFRTDEGKEVNDWIKATKKRGQINNFIKNPFVWNIKSVVRKAMLITIVDVKPLFPNLSWFGWLTGLSILFIWGSTYWLIPCCLVGCLGMFWTPGFFFWMTKKALRKHGYTGPIKRLKHSELIREVIL